MFYLIEFFKSLGESLIRGFSFFFFSCLLAFSLTHRTWISQTVEMISPEKIANPYFVAVMDEKVDELKLRNLINKLPGVLVVQDKSLGDGRKKLGELVNKLGSYYKLSSDLLNFRSLKINLNPSLSPESLDFVREQIVKYGGDDHLTASEIKYPEVTSAMKSHPFYRFLARAGDWGIIAIFAIFWIISYWLCYDIFRSRSYIIEKFQRRQLVASKTIAIGLSLIVLTFSGLGMLNGTMRFLDTIILLMVFSIYWTFSMQDWRWKPTL
jgi:hypothetical protein